MTSKSRILVKSSILGLVEFFLTIVVSLFMMPFLISHLGNRLYGLWILLGTFFSFYNLFDLGLTSGVQRYLSRAVGQKDFAEANKVFNSSILVLGILGLFALLVTLILAAFGQVFFKDVTEIDLFKKIMVIMGLGMAVGFPMRALFGVLSSHLRYDVNCYIAIGKLAVRTALIVFFIGSGYKLLTFVIIMVSTDVLGYLFSSINALRIAPYLKFRFQDVQPAHVYKLFHYSIFSLISRIADKIKFSLDSFVITGFVGLESVTMYSISSRLIGYYGQFMTSAVGTVMPVFSSYEGQDNFDAIRDKFWFFTKISGYSASLIAGLLVVFGKAFIVWWIGEDYAYAYIIMCILLIPFFINHIQSPACQLLYGISKHKLLAVVNSVEAVVNLILSIVLVKVYGILGVAIGTAIPFTLVNLCFIAPYICRTITISKKTYYLLLLRIVGSSAAFFILLTVVFFQFIQPKAIVLLFLGVLYVIAFSAFAFFSGFSSDERKYLLGSIRKKRLSKTLKIL